MNHFNVLPLMVLSFLSVAPTKAFAASLNFNNLSQSDFNNIAREFSANDNLNDVMPASSLGAVFGLELSVGAGLTKSPNTNASVQSSSPGTDASKLPHASILGAVSFPMGITGEFSLLPTEKLNGMKAQQFGGALKWTITDIFMQNLPLNIAVRGFITDSQYSFDNTINNSSTSFQPVKTTLSYTGQVSGYHLLVSPKFPFKLIEPYVGYGMAFERGSIAMNGSTAGVLFSDSSSQSGSASDRSTELLVGINAKLAYFVIGAEYVRCFSTDTYSAKLGFRF